MKKRVWGVCALLTMVSFGLFAQTKKIDSSKELAEIQCQVVPTTPFSKSCLANFSGVSKINPHMGSKVSKSLNWSGYASLTSLDHPQIGSVSGVRGNWRVPKVHPTLDTSYSACWVGIDGFSNATVEQIGTTQAWVNGKPVYYAWFSMFPGPAYQLVGFPISPKDRFQAEVSYIGNDAFELIIRNLTQKVYYVVPSSYTTVAGIQRTSAEWIVEAPSTSTILPLARFHEVPFWNCVATIRGESGSIGNDEWKSSRIVMVTENNLVKAEPTPLSNSGKNFIVNWHHQ